MALLLGFCLPYLYGFFHVASRQYISILVSLAPVILLAGCSMFGDTTQPYGSGGWIPKPPNPEECSTALGVLNWTAGMAIIGGIIAMVLTGGRMGLKAIVAGICLVILSYAIAVYLHWIMIPVGIMITIVSAVWCYLTILKAWRIRK